MRRQWTCFLATATVAVVVHTSSIVAYPHQPRDLDEGLFSSDEAERLQPRDDAFISVYTTTWTEIDTNVFTSTITTSFPAIAATYVPVPGELCIQTAANEPACGTVCCATWQYCAYVNQCSSIGYVTPPLTPVPAAVPVASPVLTHTTNAGEPFRQTSSGFATATSSFTTATATAFAGSPADLSSSHHLSPGAIAGIVIGALLGAALLIFILIWCFLRGIFRFLFDGGRPDRSEARTDVVVDERYSRTATSRPPLAPASAAYSRRDRHDSWHGQEKQDKERKTLGRLSVMLGTLGALLFWNRDRDRRAKERRQVDDRGRDEADRRRQDRRRDTASAAAAPSRRGSRDPRRSSRPANRAFTHRSHSSEGSSLGGRTGYTQRTQNSTYTTRVDDPPRAGRSRDGRSAYTQRTYDSTYVDDRPRSPRSRP